MPPLGVRDLTMPLAAFGMAIVLTVYVNGSISRARLDASVRREQMLDQARADRAKLYDDVNQRERVISRSASGSASVPPRDGAGGPQ